MNTNNKWLVILAFISIYVIWGTTFLAISYGLRGLPPFLLAGIRFFVAGAILLAWLYSKGEKPVTLSAWRQNSISGILILTVGVGAVTWAEQYISSTEAAIITASEPFWFILADRRNWKYYFNNKLAIIGLLIGFSGLLLFFKDSLFAAQAASPELETIRTSAFLILTFSALVWVLGSLHSKKKTSASLFMNVAQQLIAGGSASLIFASFRGEWQQVHWSAVPWQSWAGLIYLIIFGSVIAYLSFIWLLSVKPAALVSTHTFVNPIVAVIAGTLIGNEIITRGQATGLIIIVAGVILTNIVQYKLSKRTKVKIRRTTRILIGVGQPYKYITQF